MKNFAILGVGGYIAPRHIQAIHETGNKTVAAMDVNDSVGILDRYSQDVEFFTDYERFEEYLDSVKGTEKQIDYISICTPNHLHSSHIKLALKNGCHVICEKPLVLTEAELDELKIFEKKFEKKVNTVLQLRVHGTIQELKERVVKEGKKKHEISLTYITSRGPWYRESWKGNYDKSGGLPTNIGIHFFDMLTWIFGEVISNELHISDNCLAAGYLVLEKANIKWALSIDRSLLPKTKASKGQSTYRSIDIDGVELEFSEGFTGLHSTVFEKALEGNGFGVDDARLAVRIVEELRKLEPTGVVEHSHPLVKGL